jgi:uncharacterized protein (DUF427 family)
MIAGHICDDIGLISEYYLVSAEYPSRINLAWTYKYHIWKLSDIHRYIRHLI